MIRSFNKAVLPVSETFPSLQGEGPSIGRPSYFIRLYTPCIGCSFCDTSYSWYKQNSDEGKFKMVRMDELAEKVISHSTEKRTDINVVITGGEPAYADLEVGNVQLEKGDTKISEDIELEIHPVEAFVMHLYSRAAALLSDISVNIEIETNGTEFAFMNLKKIIDSYNVSGSLQFNISPKWIFHGEKVNIKGPAGERIIQVKNESAWKRYMEVFGDRTYKNRSFQTHVFFKLVAKNEEEMMLQLNLLYDTDIPKKNIYVMPKGKTQSEILQGIKVLFPLCEREQVNLGLRLHVLYKDGERGV